MLKKVSNGYALASVLVVFVVLSILVVSAFTIIQSNTKQIVHQENNLNAYYLAKSGIEIAYAALMAPDTGGYPKKIDRLITDGTTISQNGLSLPSSDPIGSLDIMVSYIAAEKEVKISVLSTISSSNETYSLSCYIDEVSREIVRWSR